MKIKSYAQILAASLAAFTLASGAAAQGGEHVYAIRGAKIYTMSGAPIENGTVVIRDGKIAAVGANVSVPSGAKVIEAKGLEVYPGLMDAGSQIGLSEISSVPATNDVREVGPYNPDVVAATAVNPETEFIPIERSVGITETLTIPGMGGGGGRGGGGADVIGGQASIIHMGGWVYSEMTLKAHAAMVINWPSAEPPRGFGGFGGGRGAGGQTAAERRAAYQKQVDELSDWLDRARHYAQAQVSGAKDFDRDLKLEALVPVVEGKMPVLVSTTLAGDIRNAVEFCAKQKLRMVLAGGAEAYKVKDLLKANSIPVVLGRTESLPLTEDDPYDRPFTTPAELDAAGIKIAFASFSNERSRRLPGDVGRAVSYGLPHDDALKAITINPAQIFGVADELGSIETGKIANLIVTNGDPLENQTELRYLFVRGELTSTDNVQKDLYEKYRKRPR